MRWATRTMIVALVAAASAGCGNYSTEDLRFLAALPYRQDLTVTVPASTGTGTTALVAGGLATTAAYSLTCPPGSTFGDANVWKEAKPTSDKLNAGVYWIIGLVDNVRKYPPTSRGEDTRRWGPFDDDKHPGHEIQIVIDRSWPGGRDGAPTYDYRFEARAKGAPAFIQLIWGHFVGASASDGTGQVTLDFAAFHDAGVADADTPLSGTVAIDYDRVSDPVTIDLAITQDGFGVVGFSSGFTYGYAGYSDGRGAFDFAIRNASSDLLQIWTSYDAAGAGRLRVSYTRASDGATGGFNQCWDAAGCLVYVDDPYNFTGHCAIAPCVVGDVAACATVPAPPF